MTARVLMSSMITHAAVLMVSQGKINCGTGLLLFLTDGCHITFTEHLYIQLGIKTCVRTLNVSIYSLSCNRK
jgi:hypothetical protein